MVVPAATTTTTTTTITELARRGAHLRVSTWSAGDGALGRVGAADGRGEDAAAELVEPGGGGSSRDDARRRGDAMVVALLLDWF